jgi:hypothetical protein
MPENRSITQRVRIVGLISSLVAVVAISITLLAGNRTVGTQTITPSQQLFLLAAAAALFVIQAVLYLPFRKRRGKSSETHEGVVGRSRSERSGS